MVHGENLIAAKMNPDLTVCHITVSLTDKQSTAAGLDFGQ